MGITPRENHHFLYQNGKAALAFAYCVQHISVDYCVQVCMHHALFESFLKKLGWQTGLSCHSATGGGVV
jgi:hypothetical protein